MMYHTPPAAVAPAILFDSASVDRERRFGRNVFRAAAYEPTREDIQALYDMLAAERDREMEARFLAYEYEDRSVGQMTDADLAAAGLPIG
jgi:hypothetical protein